jgi:hypothetical protein
MHTRLAEGRLRDRPGQYDRAFGINVGVGERIPDIVSKYLAKRAPIR